MNRTQLALYAAALAVVVTGLAFAGVTFTTILLCVLVLACPLMMVLMMRGHGGQPGRGGANKTQGQSGSDRS